ncbi:U3 small nucleolar ribonucleoprotein IMP3-like protein [Drosera capensis]
MRKLKYHEKKLLKKDNFLTWKREGNHREAFVMQKYHITGRDDYKKYSRNPSFSLIPFSVTQTCLNQASMRNLYLSKYSTMCKMVDDLVNKLKQLDPRDPFRIETTESLLKKLYDMGVISDKRSLAVCDKLKVSSFCRRRLSSVMVKMHLAEKREEAVKFIEQGHVRVGPEVVTDPAFHVTRQMQDFVTWVDSSSIKRKVLQYNEQIDDYDAMT